MDAIPSLDADILADRKSTYVIRVSGKKSRLNLVPGDFIVVDRNRPYEKGKLALLVIKNKFTIDLVTEEMLVKNDPERGDFIWGMVKTIIRELE